jgi:hypothetical protein
MLDDVTPHVAAVVQAVVLPPDDGGEPKVVATTLSDESGKYRFINLKPGPYQVRTRLHRRKVVEISIGTSVV